MPQIIIENKFGTLTGWNKLITNIMGRDLEGYKRLYYDDNVEKSNAYGGNKFPIGREEKNYSANAGFELYDEERRAILVSLPPGKRIQDIAPFDIIAQYELPNGVIQTDIIHNCEFTNNGLDVKQGDGSIVYDFKLICSHITWNI